MTDYLVDFHLDDIDPIPTTPAGTGRSLFEPITVEELIDPTNALPTRTQPLVTACTRHIQQLVAASKKSGERTLTDDLVDARAAGPGTPIYDATARAIDDMVVSWHTAQTQLVDAGQLRWLRARVQDNFLGAGPLEPLRRDPRVTEIIVAAPTPRATHQRAVDGTETPVLTGGTRVEAQGFGLVDAPGVLFTDDDEVLALIETLTPNNPPNLTEPTQSATLPDGSRLEVAHRVVTDGAHSTLIMRRHPSTAKNLADLVALGTVSPELARDLVWLVRQRFNMVVAGGTGSGKTTLLNALSGFIDPTFHVAIIEDTREMNTPPFLYTTRRVARAGRGGASSITIRDHIRAALRSRPDIIMVGEVRGPEALDALKAMNTGHEGSMTTCHANSAHDTVLRLEMMISETGEVSESAATHAIAASVDIIVFQSRMPDGSRKVTGVYEVTKPDLDSTARTAFVTLRPLWTYDRATGQHVKVGEVSDELRAVRNLPTVENPVTDDDITAIARLSSQQ